VIGNRAETQEIYITYEKASWALSFIPEYILTTSPSFYILFGTWKVGKDVFWKDLSTEDPHHLHFNVLTQAFPMYASDGSTEPEREHWANGDLFWFTVGSSLNFLFPTIPIELDTLFTVNILYANRLVALKLLKSGNTACQRGECRTSRRFLFHRSNLPKEATPT